MIQSKLLIKPVEERKEEDTTDPIFFYKAYIGKEGQRNHRAERIFNRYCRVEEDEDIKMQRNVLKNPE